MPSSQLKGKQRTDSVTVPGADLASDGTVTVTMTGLVQVDDVISTDVVQVSGGSEDYHAVSWSITDNDVTVTIEDTTGASGSGTINQLTVTAVGY